MHQLAVLGLLLKQMCVASDDVWIEMAVGITYRVANILKIKK